MARDAREGEAWRMAALAGLSWLGEVVHNAVELPSLTVLSPESWGPAVVALLLVLTWWRGPSRRVGGALLAAWALLHLAVGAVLSVLPLGLFPFEPEQTLRHYAAHLAYALAQAPLLVVALREVTTPAPQSS